jgi:iron complex transport system substrate-binding protein
MGATPTRPAAWGFGAFSAALAIALSACSAAPSPHGPTKAPTVVSLNPCLDAILVEVADPAQVLALSHYSRDPASSSIPAPVAARYGVTGGTAEEVIALRPEVVLASSFLPDPTRRALERAGLAVETFGSPTTVAESVAQVQQVAALVGGEAKGEALAQRMAGPTAPPDVLPSAPIATLLWQPGEIVAGEATLIAELMREEGFSSHAAARGLQQADRVALESLLADPPALVLIAGDAPGQRHPVLATAMEAAMVVPLDPALLYCGGPTIPRVRARLREIRADLERHR